MKEREEQTKETPRSWLVALRVELHGPGVPAPRGSSRRLSRSLSAEELDTLHARLRAAAEAHLTEISALEAVEAGWAEALSDGSWAWQRDT